MNDDRFITRTTFEDGDEVTSHYQKSSGLIFETRVPRQPRISLPELCDSLGIDLEDDTLTDLAPDLT